MRKDLTGQTFARWTVIEFAFSKTGNSRSAYWRCKCACGTEKDVRGDGLTSGKTQSCGCHNIEVATTHGHAGGRGMETPEYRAWRNMMERCYNPKKDSYERYGGRGIRVERPWHVFQAFLADLGKKPHPTYTVERDDNEKDYGPANCRWASKMDQARNRSTNVWVVYQGESMCLADALLAKGVTHMRVRYHRIKYGVSTQQAFDAVQPHNR